MLEGALKKCVDPYFPPLEGQSLNDVEDVEGSGDWVLVYPRDDKKGKKPPTARAAGPSETWLRCEARSQPIGEIAVRCSDGSAACAADAPHGPRS